jgi:hypothetical protein
MRGSSRLFVTGAVVALGATSFVVASGASIQLAPTLCSSSTATIRGSSRNDVLVGTSRNDVIWAGAGDDVVYGMQGNDRLCGADGNDRMYGSGGDDYLDGGPGTDILRGDSGKGDTCLNGEQVAGCESVGTTTPPPTTPPPTTAPATTAPTTTAAPSTTAAPPTTQPPTGRFATLPVGAVLPTEQQCATRVRRMTENRPENATYNATKGTSPNDEFPRVTGNFTGTTDEILQWAACKWGIDEDLVRAQIALESWWTMTNVGDNGESFGLGQVRVPYHGTAFEDDNAKRSSAYNVDYTYQIWRDCFEGRLTWLNTVERGAEYRSGDAMGCTGVWFSGRWRTPTANQYIARVDEYLRNKIWTQASFGPSTPVGPTGGTTTTTTTSPATTAPTTTSPATTAPTTTVAATTTTRPPTTTAAPTTTQAPTTTVAPTSPPAAGAFVETFADGEAWRARWDLDVHHRADADTPPTPVGTNTWNGDHATTCEGPDLFRTLNAGGDRSQHFYRCAPFGNNDAAHIMSSVGDVDGYSTLSMSPLTTFPTVHKVCWDQNITDNGGRMWTEVLVVPASKVADGVITHVNPEFVGVDDKTKQHTADTFGVMVHGQYWGLNVFANGVRQVDSQYQAGKDVAGRESRAIRRQHCLTDNGNNTVTVLIDQGVNGFYQRTFAGHFPTNARVILEQHAYTPDKDGESCQTRGILTGCRYTYHWDNITIE